MVVSVLITASRDFEMLIGRRISYYPTTVFQADLCHVTSQNVLVGCSFSFLKSVNCCLQVHVRMRPIIGLGFADY